MFMQQKVMFVFNGFCSLFNLVKLFVVFISNLTIGVIRSVIRMLEISFHSSLHNYVNSIAVNYRVIPRKKLLKVGLM